MAKYRIQDGIGIIPKQAFCNYTSLTEIIIPNSVKEICDFAFEGCTGLKRIIIPNSVKYIGPRAFGNCESLKKSLFQIR